MWKTICWLFQKCIAFLVPNWFVFFRLFYANTTATIKCHGLGLGLFLKVLTTTLHKVGHYCMIVLTQWCVCMRYSVGGVSAALSRQVDYDDSATTVTGSSCGSLTESDVFTTPRHHPQPDDSTTLPPPPPRGPDDSWKALTQHVIGGGYQIRPPQRLHEYATCGADDYR